MVLSDRRMRLAAEEVEPIMELVKARLEELCEARADLEQAELLFRPLRRFHYPYWGRPSYPEPLTWDDVEALLKKGPLSDSENEPTEEEMKARFEENPGPSGVVVDDLPGDAGKIVGGMKP
jgi:hypothetical protein